MLHAVSASRRNRRKTKSKARQYQSTHRRTFGERSLYALRLLPLKN